MPDICAYCKQPAVLTREHLWPASLHDRLLKANGQSQHYFWLARLQREIPSEPQIRDVCSHCNNVVLSHLDGYICALFDAALVRIPRRDERVAFEYDYHLLKRWLLKLSFNSARIHNSSDLFALEAVRPYITGQNERLGDSVQLFLQLSYPQEVSEADLPADAGLEQPVVFEPTLNRAGHLFFRVPGVGQKVLRAVHLRAYSFFLAFFKPSERRETMTYFERVFTQNMRSTVRLMPNQQSVELLCDGAGAWESFGGSRENKLVFRDGLTRERPPRFP
jgi:hypothetical protein